MQTITVKINTLAYGGAFVGQIIDPPSAPPSPLCGKKAFIRQACPGETVEAEIASDKKSFVEAKILRVLTPASDRIVPPCPYFEACGGCDLQHLSLPAQREAKRRMVEETLRIQGHLKAESGVTLYGADLPGSAYRRRVTLHLNRSGELGFYRPESDVVVPIDRCWLAVDSINTQIAALQKVRTELAAWVSEVVIEEHDNEVFTLLKLGQEIAWHDVQSRIKGLLLTLVPNLTLFEGDKEHVLSRRFSEVTSDALPVGHFSQVNEQGNARLVELVCRAIDAERLTELYAGAGNLTLALAQKGVHVTAVELDPALVQYGKTLAQRAGVGAQIEFIHSSAESYVRSHRLKGTVLLDPPRSGAKEVVQALTAGQINQIVYVSCSLPNLVRDLKVLASKGFVLKHVEVLDMFPQTHHVEMVAELVAAR